MKRTLLGIAATLGVFFGTLSFAYATSVFITQQGGTGTSSPSGILYGDNGATGHINTVTIGSNLTFSGGTLSATGGGTGTGNVSTSTHETAGQLAYWTSTSGTPALLGQVATSTLTASSPLTGSFIQIGSGGSLGCQTASGSQAGCLSSTDWTTFNGKQPVGNYITALTGDGTASGPGSVALTLATVNSNVGTFTYPSVTVNGKGLITAISNGTAPTTYTATYPVTLIGSAFGLAFSTTTLINAGTGIATSSGANGAITVSNTGVLSLAQSFGSAQTGALTLATSSATSFNGLTIGHTITNSGGTFTFNAPTITGTLNNAGLTNSTISGVALGGTLFGLSATNGTLTFSGTYTGTAAQTVGLNLANANTWTGQQTFNTTAPKFGTITGSTQCLQVDTTGLVSGTGTACGAGGGSAFPFTPATDYGVNTSATTTPIWAQAGLFASSSTAYPTLAVQQSGAGSAATFLGGNVGIGTSSPYATLSVNAAAQATPYFAIGSSTSQVLSVAPSSNPVLGIGTSSPWGEFSLNPTAGNGAAPEFVIGSSSATSFIVNNAGNVGIGTTNPTNPLTLPAGSVSTPALSFGDAATGLFRSATNALGFSINGVEKMTLAASGFLGLGTTTPFATADIASSSASANGTFGFGQLALTDTNAGANLKHWLISSMNGWFYLGTTTDAYATSSPAALSVSPNGQLSTTEVQLATSTTMTVDWDKTPNQVDLRVGSAAFTIGFNNASTSGMTKRINICNPTGAAGALTWNIPNLLWTNDTVPTQTTTANKCDLYSFITSSGTTTPIIQGAQSPAF